MYIKDEDFERFLKANFANDWRRFTSPDATDDVKFSIMSNHQKSFRIFKQFSDIGLLQNDYLPPELLSGQITADEYFVKMQEYLYQNLVYDNNDLIAVRMKYAENLPNMVYTEDPVKCIHQKIEHAHKIGLKGQTFERNIQGEADRWALMAKAQSFGVPEETAKKTAQTSNAIDVRFQLFEAEKRIQNAKTEKARLEAELQYNILLRDNLDLLQKEQPNTEKIIDKALELSKETPQAPTTNNENVAKEETPTPVTETKNIAKEETPTPAIETKNIAIAKEETQTPSIETKNENNNHIKASIANVSQKSFTIQEKTTPHTELPTSPLLSGVQPYTLATKKENEIKTFNGVFAAHVTCAEDFSDKGISKALAYGYSKGELDDFHNFSKRLDRRIAGHHNSRHSTEMRTNSPLDRDITYPPLSTPSIDMPNISLLDNMITPHEHPVISGEPLSASSLDQEIERISSLLQAKIKSEISTQIADVRKKIAQTRSEIITPSRTTSPTTSRYRSSNQKNSKSYLSTDFDM